LPCRDRIRLSGMDDPLRAITEKDHATLMLAVGARADRAAFARLFEHFAPRVKAWMLRSGASNAAAEELAQETMLSVWRKAQLYDPHLAGVSTWIFTIARNLRIDALRRERHPSLLLPDPADEPEPPPRADGLVAAAERDSRIRAAMLALPPEQADVVRLAFFQDKPHAEIERDLGIPLGTVKSRLRLAMTRLRAALGDFC
jgi:RNA polymerase sigma-70 factor, ECF subfamily